MCQGITTTRAGRPQDVRPGGSPAIAVKRPPHPTSPSHAPRLVGVALALAVLLAALGAGWLVFALLASGRTSQPTARASRFAGALFPPHLRAASFALTDQSGRRATLGEYRGRVVVLSFMYSHCRETCPLMATEIRGALDQLPNRGRGLPVLAISVDPAHDTRASAQRFLAREQMVGRMRFLLGRPQLLHGIWKRYGIQPEFATSRRRYRSGHSSYVMLIDRRGFLRVGVPAGQLVPEDLSHDLKLLIAEPR